VVPVGLVEMAKDRWNRTLEESTRTIYNTDWRKVREEAEDRASALAERIRQQTK
jgi:altered-inheritance-of-mitochondria protein 5